MTQRPPLMRGNPPDPDQPTPKPRPPIWAEGRQAPPFNAAAFTRVALVLARRSLAPVLMRAAGGLAASGDQWHSGARRVDCSRLGRAAALIPSHRATGAALLWSAELARTASALVLPPPDEPEPLAYPDLMAPKTPRPRPQRPVRPARAQPRDPVQTAAPDAPMLASIRDMLADSAAAGSNVIHLHPRVDSPPPPAPAPVAEPPARPRLSHRLLSPVLGYALIGLFAIPAAFRALMLHLDGNDLRSWD